MKNRSLWIGLIMLFFLLIIMYVGPYLPFVDRELHEERYRFTGIPGRMLQLPPYPPSAVNPLGSDGKGVDNFSKLIMGAKESVYVVVLISFIRYIIAVPLGIIAYKKKGIIHYIITWLNQLFSTIPTVIAAVFLLSLPVILQFPNRFLTSVIILALIEVGRVAYVVQQQTYRISQEPFVEAGRMLGLSPVHIARKYYLPALLPEIIANFCVDIGKVMLLIGQLGVLNIFIEHNYEFDWDTGRYGYVNDSTNWYALLSQHRQDIYFERFAFIFFPAMAIMYVILTFNVLGEGLRKHFTRKKTSYI